MANEFKTLRDVFLFCVDGLSGFRRDVEADSQMRPYRALNHSSNTLAQDS